MKTRTDPAAAAPDDLHHMRAALGLARRGLGRVAPNPAVGCVLVRPDPGGRVVGRGWTRPGGRPHAETEALARAGDLARGATAYVTLEPCNHHGETPPCAEALIEAGVGRVVAAVEDPDPRTGGQGLERLRAAGIRVEVGLCADEARRLNAGFFLKVTEQRPLFTWKTATTLDGRIATHTGASKWITGEAARDWGHRLRAEHDAIMIGINTALADDAELTCRLPGLAERSPLRLIADSRMRLPLTSRLVATARQVPTWLVTLEDGDDTRREAYREAGVRVLAAPADPSGRPDLGWLARTLAEQGITRVLVEGGAHLAAGLLRRGLIDHIAWFRAPVLVGGDGVPAAAAFGVDDLQQAPVFLRSALFEAGADLVETFDRHE